ncbi:MAG: GerMN domain-containing protein [Deltaproteobacteria bacterium]|nr:GerMN domain-containing protein [Deltaproteobacteria bacterium]
MKKNRASKRTRKKGNSLRYLTFGIVILAVAGLGVFFYTNKTFDVSTLLPLLRKIKGEAPVGSFTATLCFGDERGEFLIREQRIITSGQNPVQKAGALLQELLKGPLTKGTRTVPQQTRLRGVSFDNGLLTADFSPDLRQHHPGGSSSEILTVYSIVNTLSLNVPEIKQVVLLVDGKKTDSIAGHIDCRQPISPRPELIH